MKKPSPGIKNIRFLPLLIIAALLGFPRCGNAGNNEINIYRDREAGKVNKNVFGNNFIAYDPNTYENWQEEYFGYSDYGSGAWDAKNNRYVNETVGLAKQAGISVLRFPGGCGAHHYNWKNAIGAKRAHFLFGVDEFMRACRAIGAQAIFTVSYFTGNEGDAADLVEYLNSPDDGNHKWARARANNGHPEPYGVKYFEIGNEDWHGDHKQIKAVASNDYAQRYLRYYAAMKAIDPAIKIGVILCARDWDKQVLKAVNGRLDFGIMHIYPSAQPKILDLIDRNPNDIYREALSLDISRCEKTIQDALALLKEAAGKPVPVAVTEYNGGFNQDKPLPYRHCLGTALLNAEFLRILMKPQNNVLMANYWQFSNSYWGMVYSKTDFIGHDYQFPIDYVKRPNYYVYELYHNHFGDIQIDAESESPYLSVNSSKSGDGKKVYLMVVNKNMNLDLTAVVNAGDFKITDKPDIWILNGETVDATNEQNPLKVKVTRGKIDFTGNAFSLIFPAHSLTAIEMKAQSPSYPEDK